MAREKRKGIVQVSMPLFIVVWCAFPHACAFEGNEFALCFSLVFKLLQILTPVRRVAMEVSHSIVILQQTQLMLRCSKANSRLHGDTSTD
jgi:hypothetical protein